MERPTYMDSDGTLLTARTWGRMKDDDTASSGETYCMRKTRIRRVVIRPALYRVGEVVSVLLYRNDIFLSSFMQKPETTWKL